MFFCWIGNSQRFCEQGSLASVKKGALEVSKLTKRSSQRSYSVEGEPSSKRSKTDQHYLSTIPARNNGVPTPMACLHNGLLDLQLGKKVHSVLMTLRETFESMNDEQASVQDIVSMLSTARDILIKPDKDMSNKLHGTSLNPFIRLLGMMCPCFPGAFNYINSLKGIQKSTQGISVVNLEAAVNIYCQRFPLLGGQGN